jgi:hypothetical protein
LYEHNTQISTRILGAHKENPDAPW